MGGDLGVGQAAVRQAKGDPLAVPFPQSLVEQPVGEVEPFGDLMAIGAIDEGVGSGLIGGV